jgi:hypothetical protein
MQYSTLYNQELISQNPVIGTGHHKDVPRADIELLLAVVACSTLFAAR